MPEPARYFYLEQIDLAMLENSINISLQRIYAVIQESEADYHTRQRSETDYHVGPLSEPNPTWIPTFNAAVKKLAPLPGGGFLSLKALLLLLCVPATVGRSTRMLEMVRTRGVDLQAAFANTSEDRQAAAGDGRRTRAYERVKKARQRLVNGQDVYINVPVEPAVSVVAQSLSSSFVASCAQDALEWRDNGRSPGPLLRSLAGRLVAEACIADEAALSQAANTILREAALRFIALQSGVASTPA